MDSCTEGNGRSHGSRILWFRHSARPASPDAGQTRPITESLNQEAVFLFELVSVSTLVGLVYVAHTVRLESERQATHWRT